MLFQTCLSLDSSLSVCLLFYLLSTIPYTPACRLNNVCVVKNTTLLSVVLSGFSPPCMAISHREQHNSLVVLALLLRREMQGLCCHTTPPPTSSSCLCLLELTQSANHNLNNRSFYKTHNSLQLRVRW